jgi:sec-independent protein translocase protein TatA
MDIGWPEILIIALVILVLFGSKKLPDAARSLGRSMRILKTEVKGMYDEDETAQAPPAALPPATPPPATPPAATPPVTATTEQPAPAGDQRDTR